MGRLARTLAALLSAILTLLVVISGLLLYLDVDAFRGPMERRLSVALAREVQLGGPISLELSPTPRLVVEGVRVRNPDWASRKDLAIIDRLKVKANLWPLLDGELEILAMEFHGVDLLLEDGPGDLNNYTFGDPGEPALLPVVEAISLRCADRLAAPGRGFETTTPGSLHRHQDSRPAHSRGTEHPP